jgi:hypothetical protein
VSDTIRRRATALRLDIIDFLREQAGVIRERAELYLGDRGLSTDRKQEQEQEQEQQN